MAKEDIRQQIKERVHMAYLEKMSSDTTSIWQTVYGDMMTNLMLFFVMMFSLNMVGREHFEKTAKVFKATIAGEDVTKEMLASAPAQPDELKEIFKKFIDPKQKVQIMQQGEGVRLRLPEPVLFDPGKAELKPEAVAVLHEIAQGLKKLPNTLVVEGHTDDVPIGRGPYKSNWELSEARAENVLNHLVYQEGVPPARIAVAGFGEHWPFVPNDSDLNRALNRRIEILVIADEEKKI